MSLESLFVNATKPISMHYFVGNKYEKDKIKEN